MARISCSAVRLILWIDAWIRRLGAHREFRTPLLLLPYCLLGYQESVQRGCQRRWRCPAR